MDTEASYDTALAAHFADVDPDAVLYAETDAADDVRTYSLSADGQSLGLVKVYQDGGRWHVRRQRPGEPLRPAGF